MRPDYCPIGNEPCQSLCDEPCTRKPQRTWVSLTDEQIKEIGHSGHGADYRNGWGIPFARAIETKLKEKNT